MMPNLDSPLAWGYNKYEDEQSCTKKYRHMIYHIKTYYALRY